MTKEDMDKLFKIIDHNIMYIKKTDRTTLSNTVMETWLSILEELNLKDD